MNQAVNESESNDRMQGFLLLVFYEGRHKGLQDGEMLESILDEVS
jgi:hypothetical protein